MSCEDVKQNLVLYGYGELESAEEEQVEAHLAGCAGCRAEQAKQKAFFAALDARPDATDFSALASCRADLRAQLAGPETRPRNWFESLREISRMHIPLRVPVGAMALVAVGFFAARVTPARFGGVSAGVAEPMFSNVRSIEAGAGGNVQIAVDDVRRRVVSGSLQDPAVRALLLSAAREESNPGLRVESVGVLGAASDSGVDADQVISALVDVVAHDPDAGVRLKAVQGLKQFSGNGEARRALATVLVNDANPGIRGQAVDVLAAEPDPAIVGILQDAIQKEEDSYIRQRCRELLEALKASVGTY